MKLIKPIALFDLETTGTNVQLDKIVSIAVIKILTDGSREEKNVLLDPGIPIPKEATEVHGITNEMVQGKPKFKEVSKSLMEFLSGCDLAGYNSDNFDLQMLIQEFHRCEVEFPSWDLNLVDCYKLERKINSHKLGDTFKRYTGKELDGAHDAMVDTKATEMVLNHQIQVLESILDEAGSDKEITPEFLDKYCQGDNVRFDYAGKCYEKDGEIYWSFGKNKDEKVLDDRSYLNWVLNADFPIQTKKKLNELLINNK